MTAPDAEVLRLAGEQALARGHRLLDPATLESAWAAAGVEREAALDALQALAREGLMNVRMFGASLVALVRLTETGLASHLEATRPDLDDVRRRVRDALRAQEAAGRLGEAVDLAGAVGEPALVVEFVLEEMRREGSVVYNPATTGRVRVHRVGRPGDPS